MYLMICLVLALLLPMAESPFHMGMLVLILSVVGSLVLATSSTWFALILFLMYVGGMLVTLAYFLALCPNQLMSMSPIVLVPLFFLAFVFSGFPVQGVMNSVEMSEVYSPFNFGMLVVLILSLFFAMVSVVKVVSRSAGALRPFKDM